MSKSASKRASKPARIALAALFVAVPFAQGQNYLCEDQFKLDDATMAAFRLGPPAPSPLPPKPQKPDPLRERIVRYAKLQLGHKLCGLASYYSTFFDGRRTANGETYRNKSYSAAHLTLPLGSWVEVTSRATGRSLRLRVNDRGPYAHKFVLDLSQAAAHYLGVDIAPDRHVDIRVVALPGEDPLPDDVDSTVASIETAGR